MITVPQNWSFVGIAGILLTSRLTHGMIFTILSCIAAFLAGGIPFGYLIGRVVLNDDIRRHGSGNIGATNVARVIGWKWGSTVLFLDALKGLLPTLATQTLAPDYVSETVVMHATIAAGMSAIIGHMYPIYLRLRGGKGVATALGVVLVIAPISSAGALIVFVVTVALTRVVAIASMLAAVAFAAVQLVQLGSAALTQQNLSLTVFSVSIPALIIWRHRSNIHRLLRGQEQSKHSSVTNSRTGDVPSHMNENQ